MDLWNLLEGPQSSWEYPDLQSFLAHLDMGPLWGDDSQAFFQPNIEVHVCRAPGRLDVMGGIADYCGSLVLPLPLSEACFAAVQLHPAGLSPKIRVMSSRDAGDNMKMWSWEGLVEDLVNFESYKTVRNRFLENKWAGYVAGCLSVLWKEGYLRDGHLERGMSVFILSNVPEGLGVSSSAALEVSSMNAIAGALQIALDGRVLALLCQKVENLVLNVPCGVMDQMACALGKKDHLLVLRCQPAEVCGYVKIPSHLEFCAIDSGERHNLGSSDYGLVRAATFMGKKILDKCVDQLSYLSNLSPSQFDPLRPRLQEKMSGEEFESQYGDHEDAATCIDPCKEYSVRDATAHPIEENHRVSLFHQLLCSVSNDEQARLLGELMYQSHNSYNKLGLGSVGTNSLVGSTKTSCQLGNSRVHGARVTGGGSGGAVCFLCSSGSRDLVTRITQSYADSNKGILAYPRAFFGSSDGAVEFGCVKVLRNLAYD